MDLFALVAVVVNVSPVVVAGTQEDRRQERRALVPPLLGTYYD